MAQRMYAVNGVPIKINKAVFFMLQVITILSGSVVYGSF